MKTHKIKKAMKLQIQKFASDVEVLKVPKSTRHRKRSLLSFSLSSLLISCMLGFFLLAIPTNSQAQLGLLRKLGKAGSKAGKVGKLGKIGRPARALASGAGLYYADDLLRASTTKLDELVGVISKNGDEINFRSNFKSADPMNLAEVTVGSADEGIEALVKKHVKKRGGDVDMTGDAFSEVFQQGMEFVVDASLIEDEDFAEYKLSDLPGLKVRCSDGWVRPLIEKGDKKLVAFQLDMPVYILLENQTLFSQVPPLNTLMVDPSHLEVQALDTLANLPNLDPAVGVVYMDDLLKQWADSSAWWEIAATGSQLQATLFNSAGPSYALDLPESWILSGEMALRKSPKPENDPPFSWILAGLIILIVGFWGLMKVFQKVGRYGMEATVPFYNHYRMFEMADLPGKNILWLLVPFYNVYVYYQFTEKFATAFGLKQKWMHILGTIFPPALWAYMGFNGNVVYQGAEEDSDMYLYFEE